jgi:hypothetical protein
MTDLPDTREKNRRRAGDILFYDSGRFELIYVVLEDQRDAPFTKHNCGLTPVRGLMLKSNMHSHPVGSVMIFTMPWIATLLKDAVDEP